MSPHGSTRVVIPPPQQDRRGHQPSFSAALLDAIYHSLEVDAAADDARSPTAADRTAPASPGQRTPVSSRRHRPTTPSLSRSGSCSSSTTRSPRLQRPPRPCRVRPDPQPNNALLLPPPPPHEPETGCHRAAEKKPCRKKSRKKAKVAPLACLMNALLCNRSSANKSLPTTPRAVPVLEAPASARSILSSRASRRESAATGGVLTPARRAVRFSPVAVVVDDEHGRGIGTATRLRDAEMEAMPVTKESAAEAERRVEELLRALGVADDRDRAKESSESSSDLFELESFPAAFEDNVEMPRIGVRTAASAGAGVERSWPRV